MQHQSDFVLPQLNIIRQKALKHEHEKTPTNNTAQHKHISNSIAKTRQLQETSAKSLEKLPNKHCKDQERSIFRHPSVLKAENLVKKGSQTNLLEKQFQRKKILKQRQQQEFHQKQVIKLQNDEILDKKLMMIAISEVSSLENKIKQILKE